MPEIGLYEAMSTLRAVRRLRTDPIADDVLARVLRAATWAPSGGNVQPWRVIAVRDAEKRRRLQELYIGPWEEYAAGHAGAGRGAPPEVADRIRRMLAAADHLADHYHEAPVILVFCFDPARMAITDSGLERPSVVGGGSVYPAVQNTLLACRAEGLGCTLTTLLCFREAEVISLLGIPEGWGTCAYVPIGWPASKGHGPISRNPIEKMAYADTFGEPINLDE
jgi:nitroreductase